MKYLFIDIRKGDEVLTKRFGESDDYEVYNIPMNMIRFNAKTLKDHLNYFDEIYIVCRSAKRSQFIKDKYFNDIDNVKVDKDLQFNNLEFGESNIILNGEEIKMNIIGTNKFNLYNMMRIIQIVLGSLIIILGGYTLYEITECKNKKLNKIPLIILLLFGLMVLYNGITSTCTISQVFQDKLN